MGSAKYETMKKPIVSYLDKVFAARMLPTIAWGAFMPHLISCVNADGGVWDDLHKLFQIPPNISGGAWEIVSQAEIFEKWWLKKI